MISFYRSVSLHRILLKKTLFLVCFVLSILNAQLGIAQSGNIDRSLALIGDSVLTLNEYRARHRQQRLETSDYPRFEGIVDKDLLDLMVNERIQVIEAERRRINVSEEEIDRAVEFVAQQNNLSSAQLVSQLEADNFTVYEFRESLRQQQLIRKLREAVARSRVSVSENEIENHLKAHGELLEAVDDQFEVGHLLVSISGKSEEAIKGDLENMEFIREQIVGGLAFEEAVRKFADSGREEGGYLGWRALDQLPELFVNALTEMDPETNNLSQVLQSDNGLHLLNLIDRRGGSNQVLQQKIRHILVRPEANETPEEALKRTNELYESLVAGESFESVARLHTSDDTTRLKGGDLGWVNPGQLVPRFEEAASALPLNTISQPVRTQFGFHIILVEDRQEVDMVTEVAEVRAREAVFRRKAEELYKNWFRAVKERTFIEYIGG